ncbi:MAG: ABC transporter permease [Propionicimonas sp.]
MRFILRRLLSMLPALFGILVAVFVITRVLPGDPAAILAGEQADTTTIERIRIEMGLDQPLLNQFFSYVLGIFRGDLGFAWHTGQPVTQDLATRFPATVELGATALLIAILIGVPLGIASAVRRGKLIDQITRVFTLVGASMPLFWLGLLVIYLFYFQLGIAPAPAGRISAGVNPPTTITGLYLLDSLLTADWVAFGSALSHLIWPAMVLATGGIAMISRMTRSSTLEVLGQDYVRTAISKGLPPLVVIGKHTFRNASPAVVTIIGLEFGGLMGGAVLTETIFSWPGVGSYVTQSIMATDYAPVQAFTLVTAAIYLIINLLVDLAHAGIDPRVRHA